MAGILARTYERYGSRSGGEFQRRSRLDTGDIGPPGTVERRGLVEKRLRPGNDAGAPRLVIALAGGQVAERVRAVERVVKRTPARIGGIERETRVHDRHHKLRPGHPRDLVVDIAGGDAECIAFGLQIADLAQELLVDLEIARRSVLAIPLVDLFLHRVADGEEFPVSRREIVDGRRKLPP